MNSYLSLSLYIYIYILEFEYGRHSTYVSEHRLFFFLFKEHYLKWHLLNLILLNVWYW